MRTLPCAVRGPVLAWALARLALILSVLVMLVELARRVAEAQVDLLRIRQARHDLFADNDPDLDGKNVTHVTKELVALDRYERRALQNEPK